jgi:phosphate transport system protein
MMRSRFDEELALLHTELMEMGAMCECAIAGAAKALIEGDNALADKAIAVEGEIDLKELKIESLCLKLLLQQQPVATDLRQISSALKMITDMERIGDQAADIAEITRLSHIKATDNTLHIGEMARATIQMVTDSIDAYVQQDLQLAQSVIDFDDVVDNLFDKVKHELIELIGRDPSRGEFVVDLLMIAKYFERIGDHATNIAEWVEFSITGRHREEGAT